MTDVRRWIVPGRVNLVGEHLDYNGGAVLPIAIDRSLSLKARRRSDDVINVWSQGRKVTFASQVEPGAVDGWGAYVAGVVWALRERGLSTPGADLVVESELTTGVGLASSAALTCAVALAFDDLAGFGLDREQLAQIASMSENHFAGAPTGLMDQYAVLCAEAGQALLIDFGPEAPLTQPIPITWEEHGLALYVITTGVSHRLARSEYATRRSECAQAAAELGLAALAHAGPDAVLRLSEETLKRRLRHVFTETARVRSAVNALRQGAWGQLGTILSASHASLRDDFDVSCPELDLAVDTAIEAGALGARLTGAGFGGSAIALMPTDSARKLSELVEARFAARQWPTPQVFAVRASGAARLDGTLGP